MSVQNRFETAVKEIRKNGISVQRNVSGCCRGCISANQSEGESLKPIIWHYGGQGNRVTLDGDSLSYYKDSWTRGEDAEGMYFNHGNLSDEQKDSILAIFAKNQIVIDWDKSESDCIYVNWEDSVTMTSVMVSA